ncbi:MAG: diphthamide synthesis protein [Candidatus Pacearchaeota archaeon]
MQYDLKLLEEKYELELDRVISEIKKQNAKTVLLQFPDGLKPWATEITKYLEKKTSAEIRIWLGSCFGACDLPNSDADLLIQFGHAEW